MPETTPTEYAGWLSEIKGRIVGARRRVAHNANAEMIRLYWEIGSEILARQNAHGWGSKVVDRLATDLHNEFPDMKGLSPRNLKYMRKFAASWSADEIVQGSLAQLPWWSHIALLDKLNDSETRRWYAASALEHDWTRNVLVHQIETCLHERQGRAITNFSATLPPEQAQSAANAFKDPYVLDFLDLTEYAHERHLERALIEQIRNLLLELGNGFSFIGSQYHLDVGGQDYYLDLLFYHTRLHSHVVIDLKMGEFEPEFAGKMNFYLVAVDDKLRTEGDNPSIGLILCRGKNGIVVEYALREMSKPMAVSEYTVLPPELAKMLPSPEDFASGLHIPDDNGDDDEDDDEHGAGLPKP